MNGYPHDDPLIPHGISVVVNAPSVFRFTASACPDRHLEAAEILGADERGATPDDAGEIVARVLEQAMRDTAVPNGLSGVGYGESDLAALARGAIVQQRLLANSPREVDEAALSDLFRGALRY